VLHRLVMWLAWAAISWIWIQFLRKRSSRERERGGRWLAMLGTGFIGAVFGFVLGVRYPTGGAEFDFVLLVFTVPLGLLIGAVTAGGVTAMAWRAEHTRRATWFFAPFIAALALLVSMECLVQCGRLFCYGYAFFTASCI
jgi:hypothetical protein